MLISEKTSIKIINKDKKPIKLTLEPWAYEYNIPSNAVVEIIGDGRKNECIEIIYSIGEVVVYGWSDEMSVWCNGSELKTSFDL